MVEGQQSGAGLVQYLKAAFLFRWNLLFFLGSTAAAALSPLPDVLVPLVAAGELAYLAGLVSIRRFRAAIDAKSAAPTTPIAIAATDARAMRQSLNEIVSSLSPEARRRFERLRDRCREMRTIAQGVRGQTAASGEATDDIRTPTLDRLLWGFLRLLHSREALARFISTTDETEITKRVEHLRQQLAAAGAAKDDRINRSLTDSIATAELRLDNYRRAKTNAEFVAIELDRVEEKIQTLTEMAVNRQDPNFISGQVDAVAESMRHTEKAISELQHITGLAQQLVEPPAILEDDRTEVQRHER